MTGLTLLQSQSHSPVGYDTPHDGLHTTTQSTCSSNRRLLLPVESRDVCQDGSVTNRFTQKVESSMLHPSSNDRGDHPSEKHLRRHSPLMGSPSLVTMKFDQTLNQEEMNCPRMMSAQSPAPPRSPPSLGVLSPREGQSAPCGRSHRRRRSTCDASNRRARRSS